MHVQTHIHTIFLPNSCKWVIVKVHFDCKKKHKYYIAVTVRVEPHIHMCFLRHVKGTRNVFVNPTIDDFSDVDKDDIIKILPEPTMNKKYQMIFHVDVNSWPV